ncbi:MAG TPA: hypothetical protein VK623_10690 [Flavobacterium sp.]|nr:hypothetical protein [Flavobacterium sp.]
MKASLIVFLAFSIINLLMFEGFSRFNFYTFIIGALLYIVLFIQDSFYRLKHEDFAFFQSNNYLLLFAPILLFLGLSFVFGFKSHSLNSTVIFGNVKLYGFIVCFVNIVYYVLINIYVNREKKMKYVV